MNKDELDAIRARLDAVTKGPWRGGAAQDAAIHDLMGHASDDIAGLLAEVENLRCTVEQDLLYQRKIEAENERLRAGVEALVGEISAWSEAYPESTRAGFLALAVDLTALLDPKETGR